MISKALLKQISSYKQKKYRDKDRVFVVEGEKMTKEAIKSSFEILCICATKQWLVENKDLTKGIQCHEVSQSELEKISNLTTPDKVLTLLKQQTPPMPKNVAKELTLVLDRIKNPGNLGTIIRLALWFGVKNIICSSQTVDHYNPKVIQASMGAIFYTNLYYCNIEEFLSNLPQKIDIYATVVREGKNIYEEKLNPNGVIVIGNESCGVSEEILQKVNHKITIPSFDNKNEAESLNVSMATAIILSEFRREMKKNI